MDYSELKEFLEQKDKENINIQILEISSNSRNVACKDLGSGDHKIFSLKNLHNCLIRGKVTFSSKELVNTNLDYVEFYSLIKQGAKSSEGVVFEIHQKDKVFLNEDKIHMIRYKTLDDIVFE